MKRTISKFLTVLFSFLPGAGHMYMGLMRQGLQFMVLFFLPIFLIVWLRLGFLGLALPIIWCYSFFDALNRISGNEPVEDGDIMVVKWLKGKDTWLKERHKLIGYGLIVLGCILVFDRILFSLARNLLTWEQREYIKTGIVALFFIAGGVRLLMGNKTTKGDEHICENGE